MIDFNFELPMFAFELNGHPMAIDNNAPTEELIKAINYFNRLKNKDDGIKKLVEHIQIVLRYRKNLEKCVGLESSVGEPIFDESSTLIKVEPMFFKE